MNQTELLRLHQHSWRRQQLLLPLLMLLLLLLMLMLMCISTLTPRLPRSPPADLRSWSG